ANAMRDRAAPQPCQDDLAFEDMPRRYRIPEIEAHVHEGCAEIAVYIDMIPVDPGVMLPPGLDRLKSPGRNAGRIGHRRRIAIAPADPDAMHKRGWLIDGSAVLRLCRLGPFNRFRHDTARFPASRCGRSPNSIPLLVRWPRKHFQRPP